MVLTINQLFYLPRTVDNNDTRFALMMPSYTDAIKLACAVFSWSIAKCVLLLYFSHVYKKHCSVYCACFCGNYRAFYYPASFYREHSCLCKSLQVVVLVLALVRFVTLQKFCILYAIALSSIYTFLMAYLTLISTVHTLST